MINRHIGPEDKIEVSYEVLNLGYVHYVDHMGNEESIIKNARMSTDKGFLGWSRDCDNCGGHGVVLSAVDFVAARGASPVVYADCDQCTGGKIVGDDKLLHYLYTNRHFSPFEACELMVEMKMPIMVVRELMRHRTFSYNEMSGRYVQMPNDHYVPEAERIKKQGVANKQGSAEPFSAKDASGIVSTMVSDQVVVYSNYEDHLKLGLAKEVARINTPISRYTRLRMKGNLRNWLQFLDLRLRPNAQYEIRVYAEAISDLVRFLWPRTHDLFLDNTLHAVTFSRTEMEELRLAFAKVGTGGMDQALLKKLGLLIGPGGHTVV